MTQKERILVIDDEDFILQLARDILTKTSYEVKTVSDGNEGIRLLESRKFDLLLTDIRMPDISGLDVIKHVRTGNKEIPIIIITGHGTLETAVDALRLGAQGFLLKPFTPVELRAAVADALEKTRLLKENIKLRTLMPLFEFSREIIGETDPRRLLKLIVEIALKETRADAACVEPDLSAARIGTPRRPQRRHGIRNKSRHGTDPPLSGASRRVIQEGVGN